MQQGNSFYNYQGIKFPNFKKVRGVVARTPCKWLIQCLPLQEAFHLSRKRAAEVLTLCIFIRKGHSINFLEFK